MVIYIIRLCRFYWGKFGFMFIFEEEGEMDVEEVMSSFSYISVLG